MGNRRHTGLCPRRLRCCAESHRTLNRGPYTAERSPGSCPYSGHSSRRRRVHESRRGDGTHWYSSRV
eukprot:5666920-Prymnesium_polylepis.2